MIWNISPLVDTAPYDIILCYIFTSRQQVDKSLLPLIPKDSPVISAPFESWILYLLESSLLSEVETEIIWTLVSKENVNRSEEGHVVWKTMNFSFSQNFREKSRV